MMNQAAISDETLVALADGELPPAEKDAVRAKLAADPAAAARFAVFVETRMLVQSPAQAAGDTVSDELVAAIRQRAASLQKGAEPDQTERKNRPRLSVLAGGAGQGKQTERNRTPMPRWQLPMAAAVLLALGGVIGYFAATGDQSRSVQPAMLALPAAETALTQALNTAASGTDVPWSDPSGRSGRVTVLSTHRLDDGTLCRELSVSRDDTAVAGASCRRAGTWRIEIAAMQPMRDGSYLPASGSNLVDDYLQNLGSAGALSPEEEKAAMARGWSAP